MEVFAMTVEDDGPFVPAFIPIVLMMQRLMHTHLIDIVLGVGPWTK
jgi:hypothetical protein